jgi:hypothetical protein
VLHLTWDTRYICGLNVNDARLDIEYWLCQTPTSVFGVLASKWTEGVLELEDHMVRNSGHEREWLRDNSADEKDKAVDSSAPCCTR